VEIPWGRIMETIKFISFTDIHISDVNPQSRNGSYRDDILNKLDQIRVVGEKLKVDFFLCAGDLYNLKAPMRNSHALNKMLIDLFKSYPAPIFATEGNHDLRNDSYESFGEQPLSVIYSSGAFKQLRHHVFTKGDFSVTLRAFPFEEEPRLSSYSKADGTFNICMLHLYATPEGGSLFRHKIFSYREIAELGDDLFILGHYHIDQGIKVLNINDKSQYFVNIGAISRGSLEEDNLKRDPKFSLITLTKDGDEIKVSAQAVKLKVRPSSEVFNIEEKLVEEKRMQLTDTFINSLNDALGKEDDVKVLEDKILSEDNIKEASSETQLPLDRVIVDRARNYMREADLVIKGAV